MHQIRIVDHGPENHGTDSYDRLNPHLLFQDASPGVSQTFFFERVIGQGFIGAAGRSLGCAAEHAIDKKYDENNVKAVPGYEAEQRQSIFLRGNNQF